QPARGGPARGPRLARRAGGRRRGAAAARRAVTNAERGAGEIAGKQTSRSGHPGDGWPLLASPSCRRSTPAPRDDAVLAVPLLKLCPQAAGAQSARAGVQHRGRVPLVYNVAAPAPIMRVSGEPGRRLLARMASWAIRFRA